LSYMSSGCGGGTQPCEGCRPGSTPGGDTTLDAGARGPGGRLQPGRSGFDSHRHLFCPWSVTDALDFPKVADQVRLLAGAPSFPPSAGGPERKTGPTPDRGASKIP